MLAVIPTAHHVRGTALRTLDPLHILAITTTAEEPKIRGLAVVPRPVDAATLHLLVVDRQRNDIQHDEVLGHCKVVQHAHIGHLDPSIPDLAALRGVLKHVHVVSAVTLGLVTKRDHVAGAAVDLRVSGKGFALQLTAEAVDRIDNLERVQVERGRRAVLFEGQQHAVVIDDVGIVRTAAFALDQRVIHIRVAVHGEQDATGLVLFYIALVVYEAALKIDAAIVEGKLADMAFAIKGDVARRQWILRIGAHAIKRAPQIRGDLALYFAVTNGQLGTKQLRLAAFFGGGHIAVEHVAGHGSWYLCCGCCGCHSTGGKTRCGGQCATDEAAAINACLLFVAAHVSPPSRK